MAWQVQGPALAWLQGLAHVSPPLVDLFVDPPLLALQRGVPQATTPLFDLLVHSALAFPLQVHWSDFLTHHALEFQTRFQAFQVLIFDQVPFVQAIHFSLLLVATELGSLVGFQLPP